MLRVAAEREPVMRFLIEAGAKLDITDNVRSGEFSLVPCLRLSTANSATAHTPSCRSQHGDSILHNACRSGSLDFVKYLVIERKMDHAVRSLVRAPSSSTFTPKLQRCVFLGFQSGGSVLHAAANSGRVDVARFLIEHCRLSPDLDSTTVAICLACRAMRPKQPCVRRTG